MNAPKGINWRVIPGVEHGSDETYARNIILEANRNIGSDVREHTRRRAICEARQVIAYILVNRTHLTGVRIGQLLNVDHATVIYSVKVVSNLLQFDKSFRERWCTTIDNELPSNRYELSQTKTVSSHPRTCSECQYLDLDNICKARHIRAYGSKPFSKIKCSIYF